MINTSKTSGKSVHEEGKTKIEEDEIENVDNVKFLEFYITPERDSET